MKALLWIVAGLLLLAAVMLVVGIGEPGVWLAVVAVGVVVVVIETTRSHHA